jgi:hypothetical protein
MIIFTEKNNNLPVKESTYISMAIKPGTLFLEARLGGLLESILNHPRLKK